MSVRACVCVCAKVFVNVCVCVNLCVLFKNTNQSASKS